jgi:uncharacterized protein YggE
MPRELSAIALGALLVLSVLTVGGTAVQSQAIQAAGNHTANATISVSGSGAVTTEPDQAVVFVAVSARADTAADATSQLATNVSTLRSALEDAGLDADDVQTTDFQVFETQRDPGAERRGGNATVFVARQGFELTVDDPDDAGRIVDVAVGNGTDTVRGVTFTLSEDRRQELRATAIDRAVGDARDQADALADSTGLTIQNVKSVSTSDARVFAAERAVADSGAGTDIDSGPVTVTVTVDVTYRAEN